MRKYCKISCTTSHEDRDEGIEARDVCWFGRLQTKRFLMHTEMLLVSFTALQPVVKTTRFRDVFGNTKRAFSHSFNPLLLSASIPNFSPFRFLQIFADNITCLKVLKLEF